MTVRSIASCMAVAVVLAAGAAVRAADVDDAQAAVKKLADSASYSWSSAVVGGRGNQDPVEYKTEKDGFSTFTFTGFVPVTVGQLLKIHFCGLKLKVRHGFSIPPYITKLPNSRPGEGHCQ